MVNLFNVNADLRKNNLLFNEASIFKKLMCGVVLLMVELWDAYSLTGNNYLERFQFHLILTLAALFLSPSDKDGRSYRFIFQRGGALPHTIRFLRVYLKVRLSSYKLI